MLLSLAGIPVTAGFIGKFYLITAGVSATRWALEIVLIVSSVIGVFYSLRIAAVLYAMPEYEGRDAGLRMPSLAGMVLAVLTGLLLWLGVYPEPLLRILRLVRPV